MLGCLINGSASRIHHMGTMAARIEGMAARVEINPELLVWARQRSGLGFDKLAHRFPKLAAWERREQMPTFKQLESFAQATHAPIGCFFLPDPPEEQVPSPGYRTIGGTPVPLPSAHPL